jgi:REJ domain.
LHSPGNAGNPVASGGQSADIKYSFVDSPDTGEVTVAEVTLRVDAAGSTDLKLVQHSQTGALGVFDEAGAPYTLDTVGSATLTLEESTTTLKVGASSIQAVSEGSTITLDASGFSDLDGRDLSYSWTVTDDGGTGLSLTDPTTAQQTFTAPDVLEETTLTFRVEISNGSDTETETTTVTVEGSLAPVGPFEDAPTDPDGDGTYEDVNGDGSVNVADAQAIFANGDDPTVQNNAEAFDYNDDGTLSVSNAQALFSENTGV